MPLRFMMCALLFSTYMSYVAVTPPVSATGKTVANYRQCAYTYVKWSSCWLLTCVARLASSIVSDLDVVHVCNIQLLSLNSLVPTIQIFFQFSHIPTFVAFENDFGADLPYFL